MGSSLQDQLLKMGLVDASQVKKAKHQKRVAKQGKGRGAETADRRKRDAKANADRQAARRAERSRAKENRTEVEAREAQLRIQQIVGSGRVQGRVHGRRRFYFETRDGRVPFLEFSDEVISGLESGRMGLSESPAGETTVVEGASAARIFDLDPDWLRVWNG